jgi:hypothetical protein
MELIRLEEYVMQLEQERGFADQNVLEKCLLMEEETGEFFKAIRKSVSLKTDVNSTIGTLKEESNKQVEWR